MPQVDAILTAGTVSCNIKSAGVPPITNRDKMRITEYKRSELLALNNEQLTDAIRCEALHRGIKVKVSIPEGLRLSEWQGYQRPSEAKKVYRLRFEHTVSDFAWLTEEAATRAMEGVVSLDKDWRTNGYSLTARLVTIEAVWLGTVESTIKAMKFEEYNEDTEAFDKFLQKCLDVISGSKQAVYNCQVDIAKRDEYLRLAGENIEIAKAFWTKTNTREWPVDGQVVETVDWGVLD